jgi:hypothetical protein
VTVLRALRDKPLEAMKMPPFVVSMSFPTFFLFNVFSNKGIFDPHVPCQHIYIFFIRENFILKSIFCGLGEQLKPWLFQALTRDVCPDSNSTSTVQISSFLLLPNAF